MTLFEKIILFIIGLGLMFKLLYIPGPLLTLGLLILSSYYMIFGFTILNSIKFKDIFKRDAYKNVSELRIIATVFIGLGVSIVMVGILFNTLSIPGPMLIIGLIYLTLFLVFFSFLAKEKSSLYKRVMIRLIIILLFGYSLVFYPFSKYRDQNKVDKMYIDYEINHNEFEEENE